jgi:A/G-specific adenine glycosylase
LQKGEKKKIMADLYEFPYFDCEEKFSIEEVSEEIERKWGLLGSVFQEFDRVKQSFTKYQVELYPFLFESLEEKKVEGFSWISLSELQKLPFSSGHRKIRDSYLRE